MKMTDTIKDKMSVSTYRIFTENLQVMVEFGLITEKHKQLLDRVLRDFRYGDKKLKYDSLDIFFRYDKDLFDEELLKKVGNPEQYNVE